MTSVLISRGNLDRGRHARSKEREEAQEDVLSRSSDTAMSLRWPVHPTTRTEAWTRVPLAALGRHQPHPPLHLRLAPPGLGEDAFLLCQRPAPGTLHPPRRAEALLTARQPQPVGLLAISRLFSVHTRDATMTKALRTPSRPPSRLGDRESKGLQANPSTWGNLQPGAETDRQTTG